MFQVTLITTPTHLDTIKVYDWIWDSSLNPPRYVKSKQINSETTTMVELDLDPYQLTTYSVVDFVLREYPRQQVQYEITNGLS